MTLTPRQLERIVEDLKANWRPCLPKEAPLKQAIVPKEAPPSHWKNEDVKADHALRKVK